GKTAIGLGVMARASTQTLVLCTSISAVKQWRRELLTRTDLAEEHIGEFTGERKVVRPVTIATYQMLTNKGRKGGPEFPHLELMQRENWGLIVYDEVHLLPAPVFSITATIQSRRRLGLTATLLREDGKEEDVFSLIGPKKFDAPWKDLEDQGWIAPATCTEVRVPMGRAARMLYVAADKKLQYRVAATNPHKLPAIQGLLER
ncbi:MAG: DEAD/DEAH box helicase family protein, partial [Chloroflexota bacterium]